MNCVLHKFVFYFLFAQNNGIFVCTLQNFMPLNYVIAVDAVVAVAVAASTTAAADTCCFVIANFYMLRLIRELTTTRAFIIYFQCGLMNNFLCHFDCEVEWIIVNVKERSHCHWMCLKFQ